MARTKGIVETKPRKRKTALGTDSIGYTHSDSGCEDATLLLGHNSTCLECPFDECKLDRNKKSGRKAGINETK